MTRWIVESSLKFRFVVVVVAAALMFFGIAQLRDVRVDVFPEFAPPYVEIQTESLGLSAEEVEQLVTVPMEELLHGVSWVQTMRSESVPGMSKILLVFQPGTDLLRARALVQERLAQTNGLPTRSVSKPPVMLPPLSSTSRVMMIGLSSKKLSLIELGVLTRWTIRPRLMGVSGVANVAVWGQRQRQLQVQVDPDRLRAHGVTLQQVIKTAGDAMWVSPLSYLAASTPGVTGGFIDTATQRLGIRHLLPISSADDLARVRVAGAPLRLGEVAEVVEGHQPLIGDAVVNDGPGLLLVVEKFPWGNTLEVTRGVEAALGELRPGLAGVEIDPTVFRPASFIETAVGNLSAALLVGCLLVLLVLGLFFFEWRTALISAVAIPLSLVAAGLVLYLRGATINTMVLAGLLIAVGVVVDDAIIDVENIVRRLRQARAAGGAESTAQIVLQGSLEVRGAIVFATLITVLAVAPVFFLEGLSGAFFRPVAVSYALAVLASMAVALTVTPALCLMLLKGAPVERPESPVVRWLQRGYGAVLAPLVHRPRPVYVAVVASMLVGLAAVPSLGQSLLPAFKERDLGAVSRDVEERLKRIDFPLEYHPQVLGEYAERQAAQRRMLGFAVVAVAGVFLLLQAAFGSWRLAGLAFLALPSALVGGVFAALAGGGVVSLGSLVGFFTVLGIAARNGIMLINHYQQLERCEGEAFGPGLVMRGARERLSPILMTALATGLALVPLVIAGDIPGHEIEHPMAVVILGGLVTSTLLNLFIVPALYLRFGRAQVAPARV